MKEGYIIRDQSRAHFIIAAAVEWIDVFTRQRYCGIFCSKSGDFAQRDYFTAKGQYEYFYKVEGNKHYFIKAFEDKEGMLIVIDKTADIVIGSITNIVKDLISGYKKEELGINED